MAIMAVVAVVEYGKVSSPYSIVRYFEYYLSTPYYYLILETLSLLTDLSTYQSINQSFNQSINPSIHPVPLVLLSLCAATNNHHDSIMQHRAWLENPAATAIAWGDNSSLLYVLPLPAAATQPGIRDSQTDRYDMLNPLLCRLL